MTATRLLPLLVLAGCVSAPAASQEPAAANPLPPLIERWAEDRDALKRAVLFPGSAKGRERLLKFHGEARDPDPASLSPAGLIDLVLWRTRIARDREELERTAKAEAEIAPLVPFAGVIAGLEESRRRFESIDAPKAAQTLSDLAKQAEDLKKAAPAAARPAARRASRLVFALRDVLKSWQRFYAGYHPEFTWWAQKPWERADKALDAYGAWLRDERAKENEPGAAGLVGDPIGAEALRSELARERIAYTPEELIAAAEKEFAWCEERMREAARELDCGDDVKKALEQVKSAHVEPGRQPDLVRDYARLAVEFLEQRELVTIPELCKEVWRMEMMSPERQKVTPYFTGGEVVSVSFPTADMDHDQKRMSLRGNNKHFAWATVHHEVIPGHHLQLYMAERFATHRKPFRTPFLVEGWALYWELRLWDLGFARSAGDRVGMLFWRMHRAARIIVSLKFHLGTMTPSEMTDFLVDRVGHERDGATAEVRRYIGGDYPPLYQAAYLLGGMQLRALQRELVGSGRMTERAFHDAVLRENAIPIELIRASLSGVRIDPAAPPSWKFLEAGR